VTDALGRSLTFTYTGARIAAVQDWTGRRHEYAYDGAGNLVAYKNPLALVGNQPPVTYAYYSDPLNHVMRSYTLPRGNGMTFEYYMNGKVFKHYNTLGETTTFTYNEFRRESVTVNERGFTRRYFFDSNGNPTKILEENGAERVYSYDPANPMNRTSKREPMGYVTQYAYDANGNVTTITNPSGATVQYSFFNAFNQPGKIKDARGNYTLLKYDANGNLLQALKLKAGLGASLDPATYTPNLVDLVAWMIRIYDGFGNVLTTKQVRDFAMQTGPTLESTYDAQGLNVVTFIRRGDKNGDGIIGASEFDTASLAYDALGRVTTGIRDDWYATQFVYDDVDRVVRGTDATGNLRDYSYDANGNPMGESLTVGNTLLDQRSASYDLSDRKVQGLDAGGFVTAYQYDAAGNVLTITNPDNYSVSFEYDAANRVTKAFDQTGRAVTKTLDLDGKPRTITDPNGNTTMYVYYDSTKDGRLQKKSDPLNRATTLDYDANGNVISVTDNLSGTTTTTYDELNRPVRIVGPSLGGVFPVTCNTYNPLGFLTKVEAGSTTATSGTTCTGDAVTTQMTYAYDDFGRKITQTDALGKSWRFAYDTFGNLVGMTDAMNQTTTFTYGYGHQLLTKLDAGGRYTSYTRNALGQVLVAQAPGVQYSYTYDAAHRLTSVLDSRGDKVLKYRYSPGGLLTSLQDNAGRQTNYLYDPLGRLSGVWAPNGDRVSLIYDAGGRLIQKLFPNGVSTHYSWNADNTLSRVLSAAAAGWVSQHDYTYDGVGNRQTHSEWIAWTSATPYQYGYDALNRLVQVNNGSATESYTYDALGNRLTKTDAAGTLAYVYDAANQLKEIHQNTVTGPLLTSLTYDDNGNLITKTDAGGTSLFTYDALNRLVQANKPAQSTETYAYDDQGRRIQKTVGGTVANYLYNGQAIAAEYTGTWNSAGAW